MPDNTLATRFAAANSTLPLVAILRGITPPEAESIGWVLYEAGFRLIEVPLNSPNAFDSIEIMRHSLPGDAIVGAGTVLRIDQVRSLKASGGELVVMPHSDVAIIQAAKEVGLICAPGTATPTEAFSASSAGADALKIFPAELVTPVILKAIRAVLPKGTLMLPVGGITPDNMKPYIDGGATGFGLGSALYKPGITAKDVATSATRFVKGWQQVRA